MNLEKYNLDIVKIMAQIFDNKNLSTLNLSDQRLVESILYTLKEVLEMIRQEYEGFGNS